MDVQRDTYCEIAMAALMATGKPEYARVVDCALGLLDEDEMVCRDLDWLKAYIATHGGGDPLPANNCLIDTGTYTGDGTLSQAITGVGFQPKVVRIWDHTLATAEGAQTEWVKLDQSWGDYALLHFNTGGQEHETYDNRINSLDADGFTVDDDGADLGPNKNGRVYDYEAKG